MSSRRALLSGLSRLARTGLSQSTPTAGILSESVSTPAKFAMPALTSFTRGFAAEPAAAAAASSGKVTQVRRYLLRLVAVRGVGRNCLVFDERRIFDGTGR